PRNLIEDLRIDLLPLLAHLAAPLEPVGMPLLRQLEQAAHHRAADSTADNCDQDDLPERERICKQGGHNPATIPASDDESAHSERNFEIRLPTSPSTSTSPAAPNRRHRPLLHNGQPCPNRLAAR